MKEMEMYKLTVTRDHQIFVFESSSLSILIKKASEYDTASIIDPDGDEIYTLQFPHFLALQAV